MPKAVFCQPQECRPLWLKCNKANRLAKYTMFNQTKYTRWYYSIIDRAKDRPKEGYTEGHHIIPKCMGGDNSKANLVRLTAREHFICHQLLVKMVSTEHRSKLSLAATKMWQRGKNQQRDYQFNSKTYDRLKKEASAYLSELNRKRWQDSEYRAIMAQRKGRPNPNNSRVGNPNFEASKAVMSEKAKIREANKKGLVLSN